jgi:hypothetical protein
VVGGLIMLIIEHTSSILLKTMSFATLYSP